MNIDHTGDYQILNHHLSTSKLLKTIRNYTCKQTELFLTFIWVSRDNCNCFLKIVTLGLTQ